MVVGEAAGDDAGRAGGLRDVAGVLEVLEADDPGGEGAGRPV